MPELPEVETVRRGLSRTIIGKKIVAFSNDWPKMLNRPLAFYRAKLQGRKVLGVRRRGRLIILDLSGEYHLLFHLKMTGQLVFSGKDKCVIGGHPIRDGLSCGPTKFTHATFDFSDRSRLYFNDVRKFGWVRLFSASELARELAGMKLGPEPLGRAFSLDYFQAQLARRPNNRIKQFLMDNKVVVGIGNIYSDEVCFAARVRPDRRVKTLSAAEVSTIYRQILRILKLAIKHEGTSFSDYVNIAGEAGSFTDQLKIYQRYGKKCLRCRGEVQRMKIGGRTSSFCPACQR